MIKKVVAFLGAEGSGKSYNANKMVKDFGYIKLSFADALREMAFKVIGMDFSEGMSKYAELKKTEIYNGQTFRNILENLGSAVREHYEDFWAKVVIDKIAESNKSICIDDMRYPNEFLLVYNYCKKNDIEFKAYFCNYKSDNFRNDNPHESAALANYLYKKGYEDLEGIDILDIIEYSNSVKRLNLKAELKKVLEGAKNV